MEEIIKIIKNLSDEELNVYINNCNPDYFLYKIALEEKRFRKSVK